MLFEVSTTIIAASIAGYSYLKTNGQTSSKSDGDKINRIFNNCDLTIKEGNRTLTIRQHAKRDIPGGAEYVYQLPLGLSSAKVMEHKKTLEDGLNTVQERAVIDPQELFRELLKMKWDKNALKHLKKLLIKNKKARKEVDMSFDGMLKIRIYDEPQPTDITWNEELLKSNTWHVPIGYTREGKVIYHDFDEAKHLIIAGSTGFGKSVILKMIVTTLILQMESNVKLSLFDLKGGSAFNRFRDCKQIEHYARDPVETMQKLKIIQENMNKQFNKVVDDGFEDVKEAGIKIRHFIIIDEAADLADYQDAMDIITDIARRGRSAGYYLIFCTQYPTSQVIQMQTKRNIIARLCYPVDSDTASRVVLDEGGAEADILGAIPGRGIYKSGVFRHTIQTPYMSNDTIKERITPHITIQPRKEEHHGQKSNEATEDRKHTFEFEEVGLPNKGANSKAAWTRGRQKRQ